jgi:hypothetical protein
MAEQLLRLLMLSSEGPTDGKEPDSWSIEWKPLTSPTEKDIADARYVIAQADDLNIKNGIYSGEDAAKSHYGGDTYSADITIDWAAREAQQKAAKDAQALALQRMLTAPPPPVGQLGAGGNAPGANGNATASERPVAGVAPAGGKPPPAPVGGGKVIPPPEAPTEKILNTRIQRAAGEDKDKE